MTTPARGAGVPAADTVLVDTANVLGARPDGWWRDRAGATRALLLRLAPLAARHRVVAVLEGTARAAAGVGELAAVQVTHATGSGDDELAARAGTGVLVVTADRALSDRVRARGATVVGPSWLYAQLGTEAG